MRKLTVLSFGGGQDSTAILMKLIYDDGFREEYAPGRLIVVMADAENEHTHTYNHVKNMATLCKEHDIPFFLLDPKEYASGDWKEGLVGYYQEKKAVGSKAFPKSCTDQLKIRPIYRFLEKYVHEQFNTKRFGKKKAFYDFTERYGKIRMLIGISKGEEKRASDNGSSGIKWFDECIEKRYPLIELDMDRRACQDYIALVGHEVPFPSNCILCPFMSLQELLYLYRYERFWFDTWVRLESQKIKNNLHVEKNYGVWGNKKLLPEILVEAEAKFGHMTKEEMVDYKMSHGHCVMSKY